MSIPIGSGVQVRVLLKEPKGRDVDDSDSFSFNAGFSEKLFRIKINSIQMKETEEENKKTNDQVSLLVELVYLQRRQHSDSVDQNVLLLKNRELLCGSNTCTQQPLSCAPK